MRGRHHHERTALLLGALLTTTVLPVGSSSVEADTRAGARLCFEVTSTAAAFPELAGSIAMLNLTPVNASAPGSGQLVPSDATAVPQTSDVNFGPGTFDPNVAFARTDAAGRVCFVNSVHGPVDLIADPLVEFLPGTASQPSPNGGQRVADTRIGLGGTTVGALGRRCFAVTGSPGDVAFVNLTPVNATTPGSGQLVSSDTTRPGVASNVNFAPGTIDPNVAVARIGADGRVCFVNNNRGRVDLVADQVLTLQGTAISASSPSAPVRLIDTRVGFGGNRLAPGATLCVAPGGTPFIPDPDPYSDSDSATPGDLAIVNLTPVGASGPGFGQLVSSEQSAFPPLASNVNFAVGSVDPNVATAGIGRDGNICFRNSALSSVDLVADLVLLVRPSAVGPVSVPRVDTRDIGTITSSHCFTPARCIATARTTEPEGQQSPILFLASDDGGTTWHHASPIDHDYGPFRIRYENLRCDPTGECVSFARAAPGRSLIARAYATFDAGASWERTPFEGARDAACPTSTTCLAVGEIYMAFVDQGVLAITDDRGQGWRSIAVPMTVPGLDTVTCTSPTTCTAVDLHGLAHKISTSDGWTTVTFT